MFSFIGHLFNALIAQPIFNLLILILAFLPFHNFGVAIIIFTILVRTAMYPLLRKQLHNAMAMKKLQPEMKKIKKAAAGDKQKESALMMELYKEKGVNPFSSIGIILVQLPILIALYQGITKIVKNPEAIITNTYGWVQNLPYLEELAKNIKSFDETLVGFVNLAQPALGPKGLYIPAMILVIGSVIVQFFQSKQLMLTNKEQRGLRQIFKDSAAGKEVDQSEIQAATSRFTLIFIPFIIFIVSVNLPSALSLYWLVGGLVALAQQTYILRKDSEEMIAIVDNEPAEAEVIAAPKKPKTKKTSGKKKSTKKRR
jgi:YidC/Oxa1 family membrane protein insertase